MPFLGGFNKMSKKQELSKKEERIIKVIAFIVTVGIAFLIRILFFGTEPL